MFFDESLHLVSVVDESSNDGLSVKSLCRVFGLHFESKYLHEGSNYLALAHDLEPVDDPDDGRFKCEHVSLREDFDCSEASLESEGHFDLSHEFSP